MGTTTAHDALEQRVLDHLELLGRADAADLSLRIDYRLTPAELAPHLFEILQALEQKGVVKRVENWGYFAQQHEALGEDPNQFIPYEFV